MMLRRVILDTNLFIGWLNEGLHEEIMTGRGLVRYLSAVVAMELRAGAARPRARRALDQLLRAYRGADRVVTPDEQTFDHAGRVLESLRRAGREVRRASLVNDILIALSARSLGATLITADTDYEAIRREIEFKLAIVSA